MISCSTHGALYEQMLYDMPGEETINAHRLVRLRDDIPTPIPGEPMTCPICGQGLQKRVEPQTWV